MAMIQDILSLVTALIETFLLAGTLYGWPSLVEVLTAEGYFADTCHTIRNRLLGNVTSGDFRYQNVTSTTTEESGLRHYDKINATLTNVAFATVSFNPNKNIRSMDELNPERMMRCTSQEESLNLAFSVSASALQMSSFVFGIVLDNLGTWVAKAIGVGSVSVGLIALAASNAQTSWLIYLGLPLFVTGGASLNRSNVQVANLFPRFRNSIITLISSAYFASGSIFLLVKIAYNNGIALKSSLYFLLTMTALSWFRTFFLMPKMHFPFPAPLKRIPYGLMAEWKNLKLFREKSGSEKSLAVSSNDDVISASSDVESASNVENSSEIDVKVERSKSKKLTEVMTNMKSFSKCLMTSMFWTSTIQVLVLEFRVYFYFGTFNASLVRIAGESQLDYYTSVFGFIVIGGSLITPLHGVVVDFVKSKFATKGNASALAAKKALLVSTILTNCIALIMSIVGSIPTLSIQIFVFVTVILLRVFSLTNDFLFLTTFYPVEQFGKLLGLHSFVFGVFNFIQAPILKLVLSQYQGDFTLVNAIFVGLCLVIFVHPYLIYRNIKKISEKDDVISSSSQNSL